MKEKNNNGKEILQLLQENYDIKSAKDLSSALKDMFKGALQEMMNAEFDESMGYSKYDKTKEKTKHPEAAAGVQPCTGTDRQP